MNKKDFRILYDFNHWANARLPDAAAKLTTEQYTRDLSNSFRSVQGTLTHILAAEWVWLRRWKGVSPKAFHDPADFPNIKALRVKRAEVEREQMEFVNSLNEDALTTMITYVNSRANLGHTRCGK